SRVYLLQSGQQYFGYGPAVNQRGFILLAALRACQPISNAIIALQAESNDVSARESDSRLRNEPASKRNLSHQFAGDRPKTKRSGDDRDDFRLLRPVTDFAVAGGGDHESHADLVHGE